MKTIVITGSTSGIGEATALHFANNNFNVIATARDPNKSEILKSHPNITLYSMDVTNLDSITKAVTEITNDFEKIDVLLNNAGYGLLSPFEITSNHEIKKIFETNVFGVMEVTRAFLPKLKSHKNGIIINVTSIGGLVTMPLNSIYHSTKYAIEGFSESLIYELKDFGISVKLIEPGGVKTNFFKTAKIIEDKENYPEYTSLVKNVKERFEESLNKDDSLYSTAEDVAKQIFETATNNKPNIRNIIGAGANNMYEMKKQLKDYEFVATVSEMFIKK
jgi:short-subunit dehydrogenase